ncbi:hypothetical protein OESDEN_00851 [Oesophagostomum dentatum]|uniref:Uncharacterized protein n=1 Tax=Oesophagostomum dentatum TaxID=61180 RepID=A0A0B1TUS9_OESDE|nr:hypothetical protein OESDEN_00851 [Oesophagostomum dentatum]
MIAVLLLLLSWVSLASSGAVGECRSECVEQNLYKIVRVHLKDDFVMAGICRNNTVSTGSLSTVVPFICNRNHGIWTLDTEVSIFSFRISKESLMMSRNQKKASVPFFE